MAPVCVQVVNVTSNLHLPLKHGEPPQSAAVAQTCPGPHPGQADPPQSTSDSEPFFVMSVQSEASHCSSVQMPVEQSDGILQLFPSTHGPQAGPPQSRSVSVPSGLPFTQVAAAQTPPWQIFSGH